jgi:hypothetical protein
VQTESVRPSISDMKLQSGIARAMVEQGIDEKRVYVL